jgi:phosphoribosyl 1,2-cyclic phosphodiesterase
MRSAGGIVLQSGENQFHIDPGVGAVQKAAEYGANLRANTAILVSNASIYHANDANAVIDAMTYSGLDKKGVLIANKTSVSGTDEVSPIITKEYRDMLERFIVVDRGQRIGINDVEIKALTARFSEPNSLGFKFYTSDFTLTYTGDTVYAADIVEQYKDSHILILNIPTKKKDGQGLSIEDAITIIQKVKPGIAILTNFGSEIIKSDPLYEVREVQKQTGVQTIAAKDGMIINPTAYASAQGQKTLQGFKKTDVRVSEE